MANIEECLDSSIDWQLFLRVVERHRIVGLANHALTLVGSGRVPAEVMVALKKRADALARQSLQTAAEASRLVMLFEKAGIPCLLLKGAPLAIQTYQNLGLRHSKDNDLLVSASDFMDAEAIMLSAGYKRVFEKESVSKKYIDSYRRFHSEFEYVHTKTGQRADLHHRLHPNSAFGPQIDPRKADLTWQRVDLGGGMKVAALGDADLLAYLCAHGSRHFWFRLKWLADVGGLLAKDSNAASRLLEISRSQGTQRSAMQALLLCHQFWGMPLPERMPTAGWAVRKLVDAAESAMTAGDGATDPHHQRFGTSRTSIHQYLLSNNPVYLWRQMLFDCLFPSDVDRLPERLQFLYPLLRFPLWLIRRLALKGRPQKDLQRS